MVNQEYFAGLPGLPRPESKYTEVEKSIDLLDEGWARAALCLRTGGQWRYGHGNNFRCQSLPNVKFDLDVWRVRFEAGDTLALLRAIQLCASENMPLPSWLAVAFSEAMTGFLQPGGPYSLDLVFSSSNLPTNTPSKGAVARQDWALGVQLWDKCWDLAMSDENILSLDALLDVVLGPKDTRGENKWGVKKRKARTLVTRIDENQTQHLHQREKQPLARFLEKRRKS